MGNCCTLPKKTWHTSDGTLVRSYTDKKPPNTKGANSIEKFEKSLPFYRISVRDMLVQIANAEKDM